MSSAEERIDAMLQSLEDLRGWQAAGWDRNPTVYLAVVRAKQTHGVRVSAGWFYKWLRLHNVFFDRHARTWHILIRPRPAWAKDIYTDRLAKIFENRVVE